MGLSTLSLVLTVALLASINSGGVHRFIIDTAQKQASEALGVPVHLQNFTLHLSTLSLDIYGISVAGAGPDPGPPLLQVDHVNVGVRIVSVFPRSWYLDNLRIDHPVAWVVVDKNGVSNLPTFKSSSSSSDTSIFDLGIRHAVLDRGEVYYNSRPSALAADLHDLKFNSTFTSLSKMYSGTLAYSSGQLQYGAYRPIEHNLDVQFDATPTSLNVKRATLTAGVSHVDLSAGINNFDNPAVQGQYDATIDGHQAAQLLSAPSVPTGLVRATGSIQFQQRPGRTLLQSIAVSGDVTSSRLDVDASGVRAPVAGLVAHYSLANGDAVLHDLRAGLLGGELTAQGSMTALGGDSHSSFHAALRGISLAAARQALGRTAATPGVGLAGMLSATASATWGKTLDDVVAKADAVIHGQVAKTGQVANGGRAAATGGTQLVMANQPANAPEAAIIPIDSILHATYINRNQSLQLEDSYLRTSQTTLTMNGTVSSNSRLAVHLQANDLRELATMAQVFQSAAPGEHAQPIDLSGTATYQGTVQGSMSAPHLNGQLNAANLRFNGTNWKVLRTGVDLTPSQARFDQGDVESALRGRITFTASAGLNKWTFTNQSPIALEVSASQINIADLFKLAGRQIPVTGTLDTSVKLHGNELNPEGTGNLALTGVTAYQEPIQSLKVNFAGNGNDAHADLVLALPAGTVQAKVNVQPRQRTYSAELTSRGIHLEKLAALKARNIDATGVLVIHASGKGSFDNPEADADLQLPNLVIANQTLSGIKLQVNVADRVANAVLNSTALNTNMQAKARVNLTGDYLADASLDTEAIQLQPVLALYAPDQAANVSGQTEVHATLHGPLKNTKLLEAHLTIPTLKVAYQNNIQLAATAPIHVTLKNGVIDVQHGAIRGTDTDLEFQGSIPTASDAPMTLLLHGQIDLRLAQLFSPDVRSSGQVKFNIDSHAAAPGANLGGEIDIVDASFASNAFPAGLQHGNGVLKLTSERVNISSFQATIGGGAVTAQGGAAFRPNIQFALGMAAKDVRILYPQGMRESIDANLRFDGTTDNAVLGGTVDLANLSFTPAFDVTAFAGQFSGGIALPPSQGFAQNVNLNLAVHSTNNVDLVSRALSINGSANLQVRGTAAEPVILGRVNLTGGDVILNGNRFVLTGGTIQFINPSETEPVLNLTLTTTIQQYGIDLRFQGPVDQMHTEYSSNPSLPAADIINLLAFGETTEASANNTTPANQEAESLVASQVSSQVTSRVSKIAGISQLSISPVLAGSSTQGPPGATITIQQRVTGNLFITFSTNVASTQSQTIQGQYQVSPRVAVSATRDPNGGFAVDTLIKKSW